MASPYREGGLGPGFLPADDDGLVSQIARQFTDPMAFYRELVQNALDAGTSTIRVVLSHSDGEGGMLDVRVRDDGCGMDREVLEKQLLVLFRSSKEGRTDAIGKFGIGFISVLAVNPKVVQVVTSRGEGMTYRASLFPDHSWEVSESVGGTEAGTTVTLRVPMAREALDAFVKSSRNALRLWCKHSAAPIFLSANDSGEALVAEERIDEPLSIDSVFQIQETVGTSVIAVGLPGPKRLRAEFYNRGLLLRALDSGDVENLIGAVRFSFAVQDPALEHTLSREDVRRDDAFERVVESASNIARRKLAGAATDELARVARDKKRGWQQRYGRLLFAVERSHLHYSVERLRIPCIAGDGTEQVVVADALSNLGEPYLADGQAEVHAALSARGHTLIDPDACGFGAVPRGPWIEFLQGTLGLRGLEFASQQALLQEVEATPSDQVLADALVHALGDGPRAIRGVGFGKFLGTCAHELYVIAKLGRSEAQLEGRDSLLTWPRFRLRKPTILLSSKHALVKAARSAKDAELAASCLARAILAKADALDGEQEQALTRRVLRHAVRSR